MPDDVEPVRESMLHWYVTALGPKYIVLLGLAGLAAFVLTWIVVLRGKGPLAGGALVFIVAMPFFVGLFGAIDGYLAVNMVIAASVLQPKPSELAQGTALSLAAPLTGMFLMAPSYLVAMIGLTARALFGKTDQASPAR
jgi:hypothetical protein